MSEQKDSMITKATTPGRLTVIIPTYQGERHIRDALSSVVRNEFDLEVILVDDGSTDDTVAMASTFSSLTQLTILESEHRGSWVHSTNLGLSLASGEWCCILHQDDLWNAEGDRWRIVRFATADHTIAFFQSVFVDASGTPIGRWRFPLALRYRVADATRDRFAAALYVQNWLAVPSVMFRTSVVRDLGGFDESLWYTADWDMWLKLLKGGDALASTATGAHFRIHSESQTFRGSEDLVEFKRQMQIVQTRHEWAIEKTKRAARYRAAGALSTQTNVFLASLYHRAGTDRTELRKKVGGARLGGLLVYLLNSSIWDRVWPRAKQHLRRPRPPYVR
jgi:glycosyltransferase involved in cell wall biosynthesis